MQVLDAVPNKKPSMFDLPTMAELGAKTEQRLPSFGGARRFDTKNAHFTKTGSGQT
jgi:hypothetical protein